MLILGRLIRQIVRPIVWILYPYKVVGRENIPRPRPGERLIVCSNHAVAFDPIFLLICQRRPVYFMAKAELFSNRLKRFFVSGCFGAFPVRRGENDTGALEKAKEIVEQGRILGIYPEGTRSRDGTLMRFRSGAALLAAQTGADILPVATNLPVGKSRLFRRFTITFGPVITNAELHLHDPEKPDLRYATRLLRERIAGMLPEEKRGVRN
ncbi:MAG: 1-acyl-sn-glycerol-3-phosphate acyltransferase [Oscillospiraceae bacterium]|nr:1-acyl-sn-glycerol-3-phosphate acyltransferase [Oscillospiraceae bacterium]